MTKHRMLDYIREQPAVVANALRLGQSSLAELRDVMARRPPQNVIVAGLGSSYTASQLASPLLRSYLTVPTIVTVATEVGRDPGLRLGPDALVVLVSRSGERGGIVEAQRAARSAGAMCVAVTGVGSSLLANEADLVIVTGEGPESTFAKTKSVMATAVVLMQVALALETEPHEKRPRLERALAQMPELLALVIREAERDLERLAAWLVQHELVLVTGTAGNQGVAQEAVLKLQEAAGVTTEWDETGNALNGAVSILGPTRLMVGLVTRADYELNLALLKLARHFGADRLCIAEPGLALEGCSEAVIRVPQAGDPLIAPLLFLPPIHLLAYHLAVERGRNPDEPPFADVMLKAMLPSGREEPDWGLAAVGERSSREG